jgi:hypothetical protein
MLDVGHRLVKREPDKAQERQPVPEPIPGLPVGQRVQRLANEQLEHQHGVVGRSAALGPIRPPQRRLELAADQLEPDHLGQPLERIARRRQRLAVLVQVEEARLPHHRHLQRGDEGESRKRQLRQRFFRGVQLAGNSFLPCAIDSIVFCLPRFREK